MSKHIIEIDGPIALYYISKRYINNELKKAGGKPVEVRISSLGGSLDQALGIHKALSEYEGGVSAVLSGFVASSATIIAMGAGEIIMDDTAFFLVHKVMSWVDEWGSMNEDDLDKLIEKLTKEKDENKKMDLVIARLYSKRTGKSITDIHNLMTKDTWLNADEAKQWGFVDAVHEVEPAQRVNAWDDMRRVALVEAAGLPVMPRQNKTTSQSSTDVVEKTAKSILDTFKHLLGKNNQGKNNQGDNNQNNNSSKTKNMDKTKFAALFAVLNLDAMESTDDGIYLNMEQAEAINKALADIDKVKNDLTAARNNLNTVLNALDEIDPKVKTVESAEEKINQVKSIIAAKPGTQATTNNAGDNNDTDGVDWDAINNLPHNREADEVIL